MAMPFASLSPAADHHRPASSSIFPFCRSSPLCPVGEEPSPQQQQHAMSARWAAPFTAAQYEELEHQALIYKYLVAGVPVPPDLLLPIRRGFDSLAARFYHHHPARTCYRRPRAPPPSTAPTLCLLGLRDSVGYGSYFGKKLDPEPGRCRRTDGKKWRCAKEAAQDSKYCERHMHRGRNRSRKPVETQIVASPHRQQQQTPAAPATAFQNHSLYPAIANGGGGSFSLGSTQLHMDNAAPYATAGAGGNKDFRKVCSSISMFGEPLPSETPDVAPPQGRVTPPPGTSRAATRPSPAAARPSSVAARAPPPTALPRRPRRRQADRLLRRGTDAFREAAARAARDLPSSAHALDGLADIVALGKDALAQAAASSASPPSADAESDLSSASGHLRYYSRFEAQLRALQSDPATRAADPDDAEDFAAWRREAGFCVDERQEEIEALCYESDVVEGMLDRLVPDAVDAELFWARYFYRVHRLKQQEDARAKFVKRVIAQEEEEDLSWELDDEESAPEEEIKQASISEEPKLSSNLFSLGVSLGFRYSTYGVRSSALDEHSQLFMSGGMDNSMDNYSWRLPPSQTSAFSLSSYPMLGTLSDLDQTTICSLPKTEREPLSFFGSDFVTTTTTTAAESVKQENQTLRPFFDEWPPKARESWPELQDDSNFSATKLSISIPMTGSNFSTASRSPNGIYSR
ncbi:hypothetical protein ACQ4PT_044330 [Festuca glaucescens]